MEDIIDIIVTETTNTIEITSQASDELIDVNIIDNREDITLNVTPTLVEININSLTGNFGVEWGDITGTLADQTDLNTALGLKADLVGGKVPSSQLPSYVDDIVEVANYAALPATGETGKIYVVLDTNKIYRWSGSAYIEIADSTAVWGAITGTLSSQTDLQNALNAKFDDPTGDTTQYIAGDGSLITFPVAGQAGTLVREVRNTTGATLTKGTIVYISGATGNKPTVSKALATGDSTSAQTFGMCQANISNNSNGYVVCVGDITGLDTSAVSEGVQLYLSSTTAGTYTTTKQLAPAHLVYIGVVTRSHPTQGQIEVKIQNGYELDEIHDVAISSVANNQGIFWESSSSLWKNKSIATVLGYTPADDASVVKLTGNQTIAGAKTFSSAVTSTNFVLSGGTGNTGLYFGHTDKVVLANYVTGGGLDFETNGGNITMQLSSAGNLSAVGTITGSSIIKSGGTSSQFLKADGSVDSSTYALDSAVVHNTGSETITGIKYFFSGSKHDLLFVSETVGYASQAGYSHFKANTNHVEFINSTNTKSTKFIHGNAAYEFTMPNASGTIALTSNLSSYLPLSGGTLTGALSGTSATFTNLSLSNTDGYFGTINSTAANGAYFAWQTSGTTIADIGTAQQIFGTGGATTFGINARGARSLIFGTNNTARFTLDSGGAATFSSSVTAGGNIETTSSYFLAGNAYMGKASALFTGGSANDLGLMVSGSNNLIFGNALTEKMRITSSGNVGIGTTSPSHLLHAVGTSNWIKASYSSSSDTRATEMTYVGIKTTASTSQSNSMQITMEGGYTADGNGSIVFNTGSPTATERMRITSGGDVLISGTSTTPVTSSVQGIYLGAQGQIQASVDGRPLLLNRRLDNGNIIEFYRGGTSVGSVSVTTSLTSYNVTSDYRLKQDFKSIKGLDLVNRINVYNYEWKSDKTRMDGVIAHELQEILPYAVTGVKDGEQMQSVDYSKIVPVMVQAIKELKAELDILKNK